jgi:hypothetical protein
MAITIDDSAPGPDPRSAATAERQWVFPMGSKADVVMPDGVHRYWSTHCRHGNHDLCKGTCKGCAAMCICGCGCGCNPRPVEGSTPLDSPARGQVRCANCGDAIHPAEVHSIMDGCSHWLCGTCIDADHDCRPQPAGEVVSVPPPESLDEILILVEEVALARVKAHVAANRDDGPRAAQHGDRAKAFRLAIAVAVEGVRAAGVEEGRRESRAMTDAMVQNVIVDQTRAAELLREYFHPDDGDALDGHVRSADGECSVCTDMLAAARRAHAEAYELGVTEGRRQQATKVEELQVLLDHAEQYARDLQDNSDVSERTEGRAYVRGDDCPTCGASGG